MKTQSLIFAIMAFIIFAIMLFAMFTVTSPVPPSDPEPDAASASENADAEAVDLDLAEFENDTLEGEDEFGEGDSESSGSSAASSSDGASEGESVQGKNNDDGASNSKNEASASSRDATSLELEGWYDPNKPMESLKTHLRDATKTANNKKAFLMANEVAQTIRKNELHLFGDDGEGKNVDGYSALLEEAVRLVTKYRKDLDDVEYDDQIQVAPW